MTASSTRCETCGREMAGFETIHYGCEGKYEVLCDRCFNQRVAKLIGLDFQHPDFQPVRLEDARGMLHEFRFTSKLVGTGLLIGAIEVKEDGSEGYEFTVLGDTEEEPLELFRKLYERMKRALARKFLERGEFGRQIGEEQVVQARITSDPEEGGRVPMLVIDGEEVSWEDLGRMLMTFEGFQFQLEIYDRTEER